MLLRKRNATAETFQLSLLASANTSISKVQCNLSSHSLGLDNPCFCMGDVFWSKFLLTSFVEVEVEVNEGCSLCLDPSCQANGMACWVVHKQQFPRVIKARTFDRDGRKDARIHPCQICLSVQPSVQPWHWGDLVPF